jgi:hypothetical protein
VWEGKLNELQSRLPEYDIHIDSVVLGLSHKPVLMVSGIQIKNRLNADTLDLGLLRLELNQIAGWRRNEWVVSDLTLKGLRSIKTNNEDCDGLPIRCWHSIPLRVWAQVRLMLGEEPGRNESQIQAQRVHIQNMEWEQVELRNHGVSQNKVGANFEFGWTVEELKYRSPVQSRMFSDENGTGAISAGIKLFDSSAATTAKQKPNQLYISIKANQALLHPAPSEGGLNSEAWKFDNLESEFTGDWFDGYPWSGSIAVGSVILRHDDNSPFLKLQASELRSYVSRLDSPADHQAAFSARQIEGGLPAQDFLFKQAEWTYTHENAEAWTFDLLLKQGNNTDKPLRAEITPSNIPGSEGTPALPQARVLGCNASTSYWYWQEGWFKQNSSPPKASQDSAPSWVWCKK